MWHCVPNDLRILLSLEFKQLSMPQHKVVFWLAKASSQSTVGHSAAARKKYCPSISFKHSDFKLISMPLLIKASLLDTIDTARKITTCYHSSSLSPRSGPRYMQTKWQAQVVLAAISVSTGFSKFHGQNVQNEVGSDRVEHFFTNLQIPEVRPVWLGDSPTFHHL